MGLVAAALLAPPVVAAPPPPLVVVTVAAGADRATGFVAADDRVVTVAHVLGDDKIAVDGRGATVLRRDDHLDLALLHVPGVRGTARVESAVGEVWVRERPARITRRIAARVDGAPPRPALELRAAVDTGDSGAPVITESGRVAGIVFARSNQRGNTAYAVDAEALDHLLPLD